MKWEVESEFALRAVSEAGQFLQTALPQQISEKENFKDIITEHDRTAGHIIEEILKKTEHAILNEEEESSHSLVRKLNDSTFWAVDAIDGTTNCSTGMSIFASSVGLIHNRAFAVGALCAPKLKELYFTRGDQGSYLNGKKISVSEVSSLKRASIVVGFSNATADFNFKKRQYEAFGEVNDRARAALRLGSAAMNIAYVADGRLHGAYGLQAKIWDVAGAMALAQQSGCELFYRFNSDDTVDYIVGSQLVVTELRKILEQRGFFNE